MILKAAVVFEEEEAVAENKEEWVREEESCRQ
jgi:hypothetical protein